MAESSDETAGANQAINPPKLFVSYTHETPDHKRWVSQLATDIRRNGVDVILDQWDLGLGEESTLFMEKGIRSSDRVLLVCTPTFARRANDGEGGVGYERLVVTGELAEKIETNKFICVLRSGEKKDAIPVFAQTRIYIDFTGDDTYKLSLEKLLRDIHEAPLHAKPSIGPNPFNKKDRELLVSPRIEKPKLSTKSTSDIEELYARSIAFLRAKDTIGWKQLMRNTRRDFPKQLHAWREEADLQLRDSKIEFKNWLGILNEGVLAASPLMLLAATAVDSEIPEIINQRGMLDDLARIPEWNQSGFHFTVDAPEVFVFVYHNVIGAMLVMLNRHEDAVRLLKTKTNIAFESDTEELWKLPHLMSGLSESLEHNFIKASIYLNSIWESLPWLEHFFVSRNEFMTGVRSYTVLAGLVELGSFLSAGGLSPTLVKSDVNHGVIPPVMFLPSMQWDDRPSMDRATSIAVPDKAVLEVIAYSSGTNAKALRDSWPSYYARWMNMYTRICGPLSIRVSPLRDYQPILP